MDKELQNNLMIPSEHSPLLRQRRGSKFAQQGVDSLRQEVDSETIPICHGDYTLVLIALCGSFVISYSPVSIIISFLPLYIEDRFGITAQGNNILFSLWPLTYAFCAPIVAPLIFKFGRERVLHIGFFTLFLATVWFGLITNWVELYIARALQGVGSSLISVSCQSILTDVFRENIGPAMGYRESFIGATFAGAPLLGGLLYEILGYEKLFVGHALVILSWQGLMTFVLQKRRRLIHSNTSAVNADSSGSGSQSLLQFDVIVASMVVLMAYFPFGALQPNLEVHFMQVLQLKPTAVGAFYFIQASIAIVAGPYIGTLNKKTDARKLLLLGFSLQVLMFFTFGPPPFFNSLFDSYAVMLVAQIACMFILGIGAVLILTSSYCLLSYVILSKPNGSPEVASSVFLCLEGASTTLAPILTSFVMDASPITMSAHCIEPCQAANGVNCDQFCLSPFPTTSLIFSLSYFVLTIFLYFVFPKINYSLDDPLLAKERNHSKSQENSDWAA